MDRPDAPRPNHRLGPRPLMLHLTQAPGSSSCSAGSTSSNAAWQGWSIPHQADAVACAADPALLAGIAAYRRHPWQRRLADPPTIWTEGGSRLLDYGPPGAPPVLFVPSLVNRAYVLDLTEGGSMLRFLSGAGIRPLLLDWGWPGEAERRFTLTDYIAGRLERAMVALGQPMVLAGYCMGGLMAVAAALRRPELVTRLALLAVPWDFRAADPAGATRLIEPGSVAAKYRDFGAQDQTSERARRFVALEDWLNDGVPLAAPVAREVLGGWYGENTPASGAWHVAGAAVRPEALRMESFVAVPERDRIVPPESALVLASTIGAALHRPGAGHVGMVAGAHAEDTLWKPLLTWLRA